jgi:hypothetical protein
MGTLKYDGTSVEFDDLMLAHVQIVVIQKLRRQESFQLTWREPEAIGGGHTAIWLHPVSDITFHFTKSDKLTIDKNWLQSLMESANSPRGMFVTGADGRPADPSAVDFSA